MAITMLGMWLQDADSLSSGNSRLLMIFVGMVAVALMVQAIALIVMAIGAGKARKRGLEIAEELRVKLMPIIQTTHEMVHQAAPKVKVITENLVETSHVVRSKAQEFDVTATDLNDKTRKQAARVNDIVTSALDTVTEIGETIQRGVKVPLREVSGIINGFKAGMDVLVGRAKGFGKHSKVTVMREPDEPGW
jgi:methyl-accepting chemotaxis protein